MSVQWDEKRFPALTDIEAAFRLKQEGRNELPSAKARGLLSIAWDVVREPMLVLLVACGVIYLFLGDVREAAMLLAFVFAVMGITLYQERKTERALDALRDLSSPRALVIRDGVEKRIAGRDVARGDILILSEGDRVPADGLLLSGSYVEVDESLVTGESVPVRKRRFQEGAEESESILYSGTLVVKGKGIAVVRATGMHTALGKIGKALSEIRSEQTSIHRETARMVRWFATVGAVLCMLAVVVYGLTRENWLDGFLAGITLAMAILPEEFPVVLSIFLALGAWRIAQKNVLTRRLPAVETLGAATVLCVDKTGTLTQNRMTVKRVFTRGSFYEIDLTRQAELVEDLHEILEYSILASQLDPFDPMEKAFRDLGNHYLAHTEHLHANWILEQEYPLSQELLAMSHVWRSPSGGNFMIAAKGAPEAIADLCHLDGAQVKALSGQVAGMAKQGLRILAVARAEFQAGAMPELQHDFDFHFLGLIGLADPIRPAVPEAIAQCHGAGVRVVMITGDYPDTAMTIAREIGLRNPDACITGSELDALTDAELARRLDTVTIFARTVPEQKLRIVSALKANGEIVAMTGDGVNDAPALKAAAIGVAMGGRGTDVAREAAGLVLIDDDFSSIVAAVKLGRRIFDNLRKAIAYILAVHVPIAGLSLIPVIFQWPLVLMPMHIVFLELIIDPACSIVFEAEPEEKDVMRRPPRDPREPLFNLRLLALSLTQGVFVLGIVVAVFAGALYRGQDADDARTVTFVALVVANLGLILVNRSWSSSLWAILRTKNTALWWVLGGTFAFLAAALYIPSLRALFHFDVMHAPDLVAAFTAGVLCIVWFELFKYFWPSVKRGSAAK